MLRCLLAEEQGGVLQALDAETVRVMSEIRFLEVRGERGGVAKAVLLEVELRYPALRDGQVSLRAIDRSKACATKLACREAVQAVAMTDGRHMPSAQNQPRLELIDDTEPSAALRAAPARSPKLADLRAHRLAEDVARVLGQRRRGCAAA